MLSQIFRAGLLLFVFCFACSSQIPIPATGNNFRGRKYPEGVLIRVWFEKAIGVTGQRTFHNGTYHDERVRLMRFEPAGSGH